MERIKECAYENELIRFAVSVEEIDIPIIMEIIKKHIPCNDISMIKRIICFKTTQLIFDNMFVEIRNLGFEYDDELFNGLNHFMFKRGYYIRLNHSL